MRTKETIGNEIRELASDLARNGFNLGVAAKRGDKWSMSELMLARVEIYKSIAHRQGLFIEILNAELKYCKVA